MSQQQAASQASSAVGIEARGVIWRAYGPRNNVFTGRDSILGGLAVRLRKDDQSHIQAIIGAGGIGKTQVASEFAWRYRQDYAIVWWLPADDPTTLALAYAELAKRLGVVIATSASLDSIRHELRRVLGLRNDWLLIFDNATSANTVRDYLPLPCNGHVLITSRDMEWNGLAQLNPLRQMERAESIAFLKRRVPRSQDESVLNRVAQALGDHPLALEQASAHVIESRIHFAAYLKLFESHWAELLAEGVNRSTPGAEYPDSLAMSLELSFRQIAETIPESQALLNLCSYFAGEIIPASLLDSAAGASDQLPVDLISVLTDPAIRSGALAALRRYSLVEGDDAQLRIHRLVSLLVRRRLSLVERNEYAAIALSAVANAFQFDSQNPQTWTTCNVVLPHALAAASNAVSEEVELESASKLLNLSGRLLMKQNQFNEARDALSRALNIARRIHGLQSRPPLRPEQRPRARPAKARRSSRRTRAF